VKTPKPTKVREKIWAVQLDWREPSQHVWSEAFVISRGGADPHRITVKWGGHKYQCETGRSGAIIPRGGHDVVFYTEAQRLEAEPAALSGRDDGGGVEGMAEASIACMTPAVPGMPARRGASPPAGRQRRQVSVEPTA
jgi:hypothetical protein